jgi:hypothetical protein
LGARRAGGGARAEAAPQALGQESSAVATEEVEAKEGALIAALVAGAGQATLGAAGLDASGSVSLITRLRPARLAA